MTGLTAPIPNKKRLVLALDNETALIAAKVAPTQLVRLKDSEKLYRIRTGAKVKTTDVELTSGNIAELIDHDHNGLYYTQAQVDQLINAVNQAISNNTTAINSKAAGTHTHDDLYYTEAEVDQLISDVAANGVQLSDSYTGNRSNVAASEKALSDGLSVMPGEIGSYAFCSINSTNLVEGELHEIGATFSGSIISPSFLRKSTLDVDYLIIDHQASKALSGTWVIAGRMIRTSFTISSLVSLFKRVA